MLGYGDCGGGASSSQTSNLFFKFQRGGDGTGLSLSHTRTITTMAAVPSYFCSMLLCDPDRAHKYRTAISEAVGEFRSKNGRDPDVLDLGCGSGVLGLLSVDAGAGKVVSVDLNEECVAMAKETAEARGATHWTVMHSDELGEDDEFDMIVSEMLGTLCFGEQGFEAIAEHTSRLRKDVVGGPYVLPRTATQTVSMYDMQGEGEDEEGEASWLEKGLLEVLRGQVRWVGTNSLNLHPACLGLSLASPPQRVYSADYAGGEEETFEARFDNEAQRRLLVAEWTAVLWGGVTLSNTLSGYQSLSFPNAVGRECAWGFAVAAPPKGVVTVGVERGGGGELVLGASARSHASDTGAAGAPRGAEEGEAGGRTGAEIWSARDIKVAEDASLAALLPVGVGKEVEAAMDAVGKDREVVVESGENLPFVKRVEAACQARKMREPWHQDEVAASWTMRNPVLRTGVPIDEPAEGGSLALALLPDMLGECATEAACRKNDGRFGPEKSTPEQHDDMIGSLGGDAATRRIPSRPSHPLEWKLVELPVEGSGAMAVALAGPLKRLNGYAALTRHGMLGEDYMPGVFAQALPLMVVESCAKGKKRSQPSPQSSIRLHMAASPLPAKVTRGEGWPDARSARALASWAATAGAAIALPSSP